MSPSFFQFLGFLSSIPSETFLFSSGSYLGCASRRSRGGAEQSINAEQDRDNHNSEQSLRRPRRRRRRHNDAGSFPGKLLDRRRHKGDTGPRAGGGGGPNGVRPVHFPATELLQNGGRELGRYGGGEDLHVG